jgi:ABC-type dipeptide/oligopeptide/nickel transport system permease component
MTRSQYLLRRVLFAILTVLIAVTVNFFIFRAAPAIRPRCWRSSRTRRRRRFSSCAISTGSTRAS